MTIGARVEQIVDLYFRIQGKEMTLDHGYSLYGALSRELERKDDRWLHDSDAIGLIPVRGQYKGDGKLVLDTSARLGLRLPVSLIPKVLPLAGKRLVINGNPIRIGTPTTAALIPASALYSHIVTTKHGNNENRFDEEIKRQLAALDIKGETTRGPRRVVAIKDKTVVGYSLLVSNLAAQESICLQERGLGGRRKMGCGVFVASVQQPEKTSL